jgi:MFS family permease
LLAVGYFFEGLGYIVTATFLVAIISLTPGLEDFAPYSWVAVGLAAVPSTIFWPYLGRRIGNRKALLGAYLLQAAGILVSVWAESMTTVLFVAVSFGSTFLGIVALTLTEGNLRMPGDGRRAAAFLTASFGVGQVLGPVLAGTLADIQEGFTVPLVLATVCVAIAGLCVLLDRQFQSQ